MSAEPATTEPKPRRTVIAGYEILEEMGRGPLGRVFKARHVKTGNLVVFRGFHRPPDADDEDWNHAVDRFREVLRAHDSIEAPIEIQDVGEWGEIQDLFWLTSEYFEGRNLRQILDEDGPQSLDWALGIFGQVAKAIDYAAGHGLHHGDLTPHNILLTEDGSIRVINYGLGHIRNKVGSPYLAPEQLDGSDGEPRSDIYAMGALLYETLSGQAPFEGATAEETCRRIQTLYPEPLPGQPAWVQEVVAKMMAKAPAARYSDAGAAIDDLALRRSPAEPPPLEEAPPPLPWQASHYQPGASLQKYALHEQDILAAHRRISREVLLGRVRVWTAWAAVFALLVAFVQHAQREPDRHRIAQVVAMTGTPVWANVQQAGPLRPGDRINGDSPVHLATDAHSTVALAMRGARIKLMPNSWAVIHQLGYEHGRVREIELRRGALLANVAWMPRLKSRFEVSCGGLQVAVRGTLFSVASVGAQTEVRTVRGRVQVSGAKAEQVVRAGQKLAALRNGELAEPAALSEAERQELLAQPDLLARGALDERLGEWLGDLGESVVLPPAELVSGLVDHQPGEGLVAQVQDKEAINRAKVAMMAISVALMMEGTELPETLDLATLAELNLDAEQDERILKCFHSRRLEYYHRLSGDSYEVGGRATDSKATLVRCKTGAVTAEGDEDRA